MGRGCGMAHGSFGRTQQLLWPPALWTRKGSTGKRGHAHRSHSLTAIAGGNIFNCMPVGTNPCRVCSHGSFDIASASGWKVCRMESQYFSSAHQRAKLLKPQSFFHQNISENVQVWRTIFGKYANQNPLGQSNSVKQALLIHLHLRAWWAYVSEDLSIPLCAFL